MKSRIMRYSLDGKEMLFFGTIKGLVNERKVLRGLVEEFQPDIFLLGISPEQMDGLRSYLSEPFEIYPDDYEVIYAIKLEEFGEVGLPVPTYLEAFAISREKNIVMLPLDIPEKEYSDMFVKKVEFYHILWSNFRKKKLYRKKFEARTAEEFVMEWDREVNNLKPFREIERERERYMAQRIRDAVKNRKERKFLVIVELERLHGILKDLNLLHIR